MQLVVVLSGNFCILPVTDVVPGIPLPRNMQEEAKKGKVGHLELFFACSGRCPRTKPVG